MNLISKLLCVVGCAALLGGCTTTSDMTRNYDHQGKVWRMVVFKPMVSFTGLDDTPASPGSLAERVGVTKEFLQGLRWARVRYIDAPFLGTVRWTYAAVPDSISSTDIAPDAVVDVLVEKNLDLNYGSGRVTRVVRLVCKPNEPECLQRVAKDGSLNSVINANPAPGENFGQSYHQRISKDEYLKYLESTK